MPVIPKDTGSKLKRNPQETKTCLNRSCTWSAGVNAKAKAKIIYMIDLSGALFNRQLHPSAKFIV